ncbi:MAG: hypothetical protein ACXWWI_05500 [Nitrospira sp.]
MSQMRHGQESVSEPIPLNNRMRCRSGILIFSRQQKLLHANRRALKLIGHLDQAKSEPICEINCAPVREIQTAIQVALDHRRTANIWEPFELKRVLFGSRCKIRVRGLGLADRNSHDNSRIVIVLEEVDLRQECCEPERQVIGASKERRVAAILGSAQPGSDRGVFDV